MRGRTEVARPAGTLIRKPLLAKEFRINGRHRRLWPVAAHWLAKVDDVFRSGIRHDDIGIVIPV